VKPFTATVVSRGFRGLSAANETCAVLNLRLDKLELVLLGFDVNLDKVILTIDADSAGGALGSLFCSLANAKVSVKTDVRTTSSAARKLTSAVRASGLNSVNSGLGFATPVRAGAASATGTCPVLDLVLGRSTSTCSA
jgi:hypothetical protein